MALDDKDIQDVRLSRPVPVVDLWDIDDRISRLEEITERLKKIVDGLAEIYRTERVKNWEMILQKILNKEMQKGNYGNRVGRLKNDV